MLADTLKIVLGTTSVYGMKAHQFHWNTEGAMFVSLHKLFGNIYEDANDAVDPLAEYIRALQVYAGSGLLRLWLDPHDRRLGPGSYKLAAPVD